jgi:hypothetical protein
MRPRTPLAKAEATGQTLNHPARFADRTEPTAQPLSAPPQHLKGLEAVAWEQFRHEVHWLTEADRKLVEVASRLQAKIWDGGSMQAITALLRCLSLMGATPTDRSRVCIPPAESKDPAEEFVN